MDFIENNIGLDAEIEKKFRDHIKQMVDSHAVLAESAIESPGELRVLRWSINGKCVSTTIMLATEKNGLFEHHDWRDIDQEECIQIGMNIVGKNIHEF